VRAAGVVLRYGSLDGHLNPAGRLDLANRAATRPWAGEDQIDQPNPEPVPDQVHPTVSFRLARVGATGFSVSPD
jgi:hypothetical protein